MQLRPNSRMLKMKGRKSKQDSSRYVRRRIKSVRRKTRSGRHAKKNANKDLRRIARLNKMTVSGSEMRSTKMSQPCLRHQAKPRRLQPKRLELNNNLQDALERPVRLNLPPKAARKSR